MNQTINLKYPNFTLSQFSIGTVWLFHISAIIGISIGYADFFFPKTPLNLSLMFLFLALSFPKPTKKYWLGTAIFFAVGYVCEWLGVNYGLLFGTYVYGSNLGIKLDGVPLLIGINWAVLVLITGAIAHRFLKRNWLKAIFGAALMVFLDLFLEASAPIFDFWEFENNFVPLQNYIAWFVIAWLLHHVYGWFQLHIDYLLALNLYLAQLVFFLYFYVFYQV